MSRRAPGKQSRLGEIAPLNIGSGLTTSGGDLQSTAGSVTANGKNILINGDFVFDQRRGDNTAYTSATTPVNSDDTFLLDRWILLSDGNDTVDVTQEAVGTSSDIPSDGRGAIKLDVETANKKFGIFQPIETANSKHIDGQVVSLSFKVKAGGGSTISNIRAGIVQLATGSEDSFVSDIVSAWNAAGSDPSLNVGWSYANTPANTALTTSYQTVKIENVTMSALGNAGIFIWVDDTDPIAGEFVFIADVQLETGDMSTAFERRPIQDELSLCQRYFTKTFASATIPVQSAGVAAGLEVVANSAGRFIIQWELPQSMRAAPTVVTFNPSAANASARNLTDSDDDAVTATAAEKRIRIIPDVDAEAGNANDRMILHATAESEL